MIIEKELKKLKILTSKLKGIPKGKPPLEEVKNILARLKDNKTGKLKND